MEIPIPTPIYRIIHIDNLSICLKRAKLFAPNYEPDDGLICKKIHNSEIQENRRNSLITCGPCGNIHDYIPFYLGPRSPMLFQLHTGWVADYQEGQEPIVYLVLYAQNLEKLNIPFVFSDGHGIARFTYWYDDLNDLDKVDWDAVYARIWRDTDEDNDKQRRKQSEFLVYKELDWNLISTIAVINADMKKQVESILDEFSQLKKPPVIIQPKWYY